MIATPLETQQKIVAEPEEDLAAVAGAKRASYGEEIVSVLRRQLTWTHFKSLIYLDGVLMYASAQSLDFLARTKTPSFPDENYLRLNLRYWQLFL